jgi:hypothetical protein
MKISPREIPPPHAKTQAQYKHPTGELWKTKRSAFVTAFLSSTCRFSWTSAPRTGKRRRKSAFWIAAVETARVWNTLQVPVFNRSALTLPR